MTYPSFWSSMDITMKGMNGRLFFLRENPRRTASFVNHLFFRRVELKNYSPA